MRAECPVVSIIVPAYNAAHTLDECVQSAVNQSWTNWEMIICDDGSSDGTWSLAQRWVQRDQRIKVLQQANSGVSLARNNAVVASRGEFLAFLDADDRWDSTKLEQQLNLLNSDFDIDVCFTRATFVGPEGTPTGTLSANLNGPIPARVLLYGNPATTCSSIMVRRSAFDVAGGFDSALKFAEDLEWLLRVVCTTGKPAYALPGALTDYRCSLGGLSSQLERMHEGWECMVQRARGFAPQLLAAHERPARAAHLNYLARRALRLRLPSHMVRRFLARSVASDRSILMRDPARLLLVLAASCLPNALIPRRL